MIVVIIKYDSKRISSFIFIDEDMKSFIMADKLLAVDHTENGNSVSDGLKHQWR
jgi:hypothetical protein